jgi:hypothetical protein
MPLPWLLRIFMILPICTSLWHSLFKSPRILGLRLSASGKIECLFADGQHTGSVVLRDSTVFSHLIILRMRIGDAAMVTNLTLLPDSISEDQFRTLRLWLRWCDEANESDDKNDV